MKPSDLKPPFPWNNQRIVIDDRIVYVPLRIKTEETLTLPDWNHPTLFGNDHPLMIEYCSGNGAWIADKALANPLVNWIAVEKKFTRVRKIWSKIKNLKLSNLIVVCGEAHLATKLFFPSDCFYNAFMNFPDPWPKKRHAKHRLIRPEFVMELWRILKPSSAFTVVTDDPDYSIKMIDELGRFTGFKSCFADPYFVTDISDYGTSYFDQLWRQKGKTIRFHQYRKVC
jgi:tRNA (guanine-N7-)-methyltransferase